MNGVSGRKGLGTWRCENARNAEVAKADTLAFRMKKILLETLAFFAVILAGLLLWGFYTWLFSLPF
jgi:hypothetical protein